MVWKKNSNENVVFFLHRQKCYRALRGRMHYNKIRKNVNKARMFSFETKAAQV